MPKPPDLPPVDWTDVLARGADWEAWIANAENPERGAAMAIDAEGFAVPAAAAAELAALAKPVQVVAIAEDWCGDVVRHAPVMAALARAAGGAVTVRWLARADAPEVFVRFLTCGGEAIPKFVFLSADLVETGWWGPMPTACRELIAAGKACNDVVAARKLVGAAYAADPERGEVVAELTQRLRIAATVTLEPPAG